MRNEKTRRKDSDAGAPPAAALLRREREREKEREGAGGGGGGTLEPRPPDTSERRARGSGGSALVALDTCYRMNPRALRLHLDLTTPGTLQGRTSPSCAERGRGDSDAETDDDYDEGLDVTVRGDNLLSLETFLLFESLETFEDAMADTGGSGSEGD
eukprot:Rhum_TRINITY_DN8679_c1_g1::Rhum_TRINITY_DN8679_c1_g1_i1::g.29322::m.29322